MNFAQYVAPSTGRPIRAVLFDTFGTVVDWRSGVAAEIRIFAENHQLALNPLHLADKWRELYQPSMEKVRSGERNYVPLDQLHLENLLAALKAIGISPETFQAEDLRELNAAWERLPAWPDSCEGLTQLKAHYIVGPLSNGNTALLVNMAKYAGLPWDTITGLDLLQAYKPDPTAYTRAVEVLRLEPGEVMLAAAHNDDLLAAREAGLATAFVLRAHEHGSQQTSDLGPTSNWDVIVENLVMLADALTGRPQTR